MPVELTEDFRLHGDEIGFADAPALIDRGRKLLSAQQTVAVDCHGLVQANSVTVAVFLDWFRYAELNNVALVFVNLSEELRNIVNFSGLDDVLPLR